MTVIELKTILNSLSSDFDNNVLRLKDETIKDIRDLKISKTDVKFTVVDNYSETIFDDMPNELICNFTPSGKKLAVVKALKESLNLGLKEAKDIADRGTPFVAGVYKTVKEAEKIASLFPEECTFNLTF